MSCDKAIIFDLDYTLLDTLRFKKEEAKIFGLSFGEYEYLYNLHFRFSEQNYNDDRFIKILLEEGIINKADIYKIYGELSELFKSLDNFLFENVGDILMKLFNKKVDIYLFSYGNLDHQGKKIESLSIKRFFKKVIVTNGRKHKLAGTVKASNFIMVNDNVQECIDFKSIIPNMEIVLVDGPYSNIAEHNLVVHNPNSLDVLLKMV